MKNEQTSMLDAFARNESFKPLGGAARPRLTARQVPSEADPEPLVLSAIKKRWWLLPFVILASGVAGYLAADQFAEESSHSRAAILHRGLPGVPGADVYESLGPKTCSDLITSPNVLHRVLAKHSLEMPVSSFEELITVQLTHQSNLMNVEFYWSDPTEAPELLNDLLDEFIEYVADSRRSTLREYIKHVEVASMAAKAEVDLARSERQDYQRREQQRMFAEGGLSPDFYNDLLSNVSTAQFAIEDEQVAKSGLEQQLQMQLAKEQGFADQLHKVEQETKHDLIRETVRMLKNVQESYAPSARPYATIGKKIESLENFAETGPDDFRAWLAELSTSLMDGTIRMSENSSAELEQAHQLMLAAHADRAGDLESELRSVRRVRESLELRVFPVQNQIVLLESRLGKLQTEADGIGEPVASLSGARMEELEVALEEAEEHRKSLALQLANMRELENCRVNEWSVSTPASLETTQVSSTFTKIFAFTFGLCGLALMSPLVLAEWWGRREAPQAEFAKSMHLPLVAERVMSDFLPRPRKRRRLDELRPATLEAVRKLALRIQQSCVRSDHGATIVFSSLDPQVSSAALMAAVGECLKEREESVLLINAVSSDRSTSWIAAPDAAVVSGKQNGSATTDAVAISGKGLAEYLSAECEEVHELITQTGCPGVDAIDSGTRTLPREAMASSSLARLLDACSHNYSMILVNGPSANWSADLEMLAAHADGLILTATERVIDDPEAREAVADLIELQAPIIGIVS